MAPANPAPPPFDHRLLAAAPELATLALLETALTVCTAALLAEHPTLGHDLRPDPEPPSLREARGGIAPPRPLRSTGAPNTSELSRKLSRESRCSDALACRARVQMSSQDTNCGKPIREETAQ